MAASDFIFFRGDDVTIEKQLTLTSGTDFFEVKLSIKQNIDDEEICFQASKQEGTLTYNAANTTITVNISNQMTKDFTGQYVYDIQTNSSGGGDVTTQIKGFINFQKDVTTS